MEYTNQDQQTSKSYYYTPSLQQQQQQQQHHQPQQYGAPVNRSRPPTPTTSIPYMSAPGSYPSSQGSNSYDTAQMNPHRTGEASSSRGTVSPGEARSGPNGNGRTVKRIGGKANVSSACGPCKKAHLACDIQRPCKRCTNMGKEDQCEDVPHKKRGRPKVNKAPMGTPYQRARPPNDDMIQYRQSLPPYPNPPPGNYDPMYHPQQDYNPFYQGAPPPPQARIPSPQMAGSDPPNLFTLFTTTDLRIMRVSQGSWGLTGYHQPDFMGHSLLDWVIPADRGLLEEDRMRLLMLPNSTMLPESKWELLQGSVHHRTERELVSPAEGMGEYPNQNVRIVRSDQQYNLFNVRLHLGGGLGGSLYHPDTYDRLYLVVSCLMIPPPGPPLAPNSRAVSSGTIASSYGPPTPITPMTAAPPGGLPGFSQIAAGVEAPPPAMGQRYPSAPYSSYFPSRPTSQQQQQPISTPGVTVAYPRSNSTPQAQGLPSYPNGQTPSNAMYAKSPSQELQTPSYPYEYSQQQQQQQQQHDQAYYPDYREDQWNRHDGDGNPPPLQQLPPPPQTSSSSSSNPPPPNDYSRRPWES